MQPTNILLGLSITASALLLACGGSEGPPVAGTPVNEGATPAMQKKVDEAVVDQVTNARCDHEETCKGIGDGQKYATRKVCTEDLRSSMSNDLNAYKCPRGIDSKALDQCMASIKAEECGHPFDSLQRHQKCMTDNLCLD